MQRFVQRTWKPTLAFMALSWIITGIAAGNVFLVALPALLLTPVLWWLWVGRRDRPEPRHGAIAGALAAVVAQCVPLAISVLWFGTVRPYGGGSDWMRSLNDQMAGAQIVGAMAGAALGSVIGSLLARGRLPRV